MSEYENPQDPRRSTNIKDPLRRALDMLVRGNWTQRREAGCDIAERIEDLEGRVLELEHRTGDHRRKKEKPDG